MSGKFSSASYFYENTWKVLKHSGFGTKTWDLLLNTKRLQINCHLVSNLYLNIDDGKVLFEKCQM